MALRLIIAPTAEPVTLAEAKAMARVDGTDLDAVITTLIAAARRQAEHRTGRALISQTWELVLDAFPAAEIKLGLLPLQSIESVKYYDAAGVLQTMAGADYVLDGDLLPGWLLPAYGADWPDTYDQANAVIVRMVAGYGNAGADVPEDIRLWLFAQITASLDNPAGLINGQAAPLKYLDGLLDCYRINF